MTRLDPTPPAPTVPPARPAAPRPLTPALRRASWLEPHVRFWWLLATVMLLLVVALVVQAVIDQHTEDRLFLHGTKVNALVGGGITGQRVSPDTPVDLTFTLNGTDYAVNGLLEGRTDYIERGTTVPILVDPSDPNHWTYRTVGPSFSSQLVAPAIAAAVLLIAAAVALLEHARTQKAFTRGEPWLGRVVSVNSSALAPLAKQVRVVAADAKQRQVMFVFVPGTVGRSLQEGDLLWLASSGPRTGRTVPLIG